MKLRSITITQALAIIVSSVGFLLMLRFSLSSAFNDWSWQLNADTADHFGSLIGGVVGSLFSLAGVFLLYETLISQQKSIESQQAAYHIQQFESKFFELIRYHRENVFNLKYVVANSTTRKEEHGTQVVIELKKQIIKLLPKVKAILEHHTGFRDRRLEEETLNISYLIFYFGVGHLTKETTRKYLLKSGYTEDLCNQLINEIRREKTKYNDKIVFYGGHQSKLGHYFRHLYYSISFVADDTFLNETQKYQYIRMLRAQLTNYEQALLFFNSMSIIGKAWRDNDWITKYRLIKNIPPEFIGDINPKEYFTTINFEWEQ